MVLLDVIMDTLNGIDCARIIREKINSGLYYNVIIIGYTSMELELEDNNQLYFDYLL